MIDDFSRICRPRGLCTKRGTDLRPVVVQTLARPSVRGSVPLFVQSPPAGATADCLRALDCDCAQLLLAQEDSETAVARLANGNETAGSLRSITEGSLRLGEQSLPVADIVRLNFRGRVEEVRQRATLIQLINGDRVVAGLTNMVDEAVVALWKSHPEWPPVRIPSETIAGILMSAPAEPAQRARWFTRVFSRGSKSDVVLLQNGDRRDGRLALV